MTWSRRQAWILERPARELATGDSLANSAPATFGNPSKDRLGGLTSFKEGGAFMEQFWSHWAWPFAAGIWRLTESPQNRAAPGSAVATVLAENHPTSMVFAEWKTSSVNRRGPCEPIRLLSHLCRLPPPVTGPAYSRPEDSSADGLRDGGLPTG